MSGDEARPAPPRPITVELVGPPGAGKSTIFEGLLSRDHRIEPRPIPSKRSYLGPMGRNVPLVLLMALRHRTLSCFAGDGLQSLAYLRVLPRMLEDRPSERVVVFDQGPIFLLTRPGVLHPRLATWHAQALDTWSALLDVVVLLDAPDEMLVDRINARSKEHRIKGASVDTAAAFIAQSRAVYSKALDGLDARAAAPTILRLDTSRLPVDRAVEDIIAAVERRRARPGERLAVSPP